MSLEKLSANARTVLAAIHTLNAYDADSLSEHTGMNRGLVIAGVGALKLAKAIVVEDGVVTLSSDALELVANLEIGITTEKVVQHSTVHMRSSLSGTVNQLSAPKQQTESRIITGSRNSGESKPRVTRTPRTGPTKVDTARELYKACKDDGKTRKEMIAHLMTNIPGMSQHCANTYLYNFQREDGLVKTRNK